MARRKKQSVAEGLLDVVARLPWWAGVGLAVALYLVFHAIAGKPIPTVTNPRQVAAMLPGMWLRGISAGMQYILPLLCLAGALASFLRRKQRATLVTTVTQSASAESLNGISWQEFEGLVGEAFRLQGYEVREQGGAGPDGGIDLVARKGKETYLVQCKQWRALKVGVDVVRELYGVMAAHGAAGGFVVTSGRFTDDAIHFAAGRNLRLIDGPKLFGLIQQVTRARTSKAPAASAPGIPALPPATVASSAAFPGAAPAASRPTHPAPACPKCDGSMVLRTAGKGSNEGKQFWGCSAFPKCRGTRPA